MMNTSQAGGAANDIVGVFFLLASVAFVLAGDRDRTAATPPPCSPRSPPGLPSGSS